MWEYQDVEDKPIEELTFEEAMAALEAVVGQIESNELSLDDTLDLFERGALLARRCGTLLDHAELRVAELSEILRGDPNPLPGAD